MGNPRCPVRKLQTMADELINAQIDRPIPCEYTICWSNEPNPPAHNAMAINELTVNTRTNQRSISRRISGQPGGTLAATVGVKAFTVAPTPR